MESQSLRESNGAAKHEVANNDAGSPWNELDEQSAIGGAEETAGDEPDQIGHQPAKEQEVVAHDAQRFAVRRIDAGQVRMRFMLTALSSDVDGRCARATFVTYRGV